MAYANDSRRQKRSGANGRMYYGALNAIGGLNGYSRYMFPPDCLRPSMPIDPIYRGPCPPNPDGTDLEDVYAFFYQDGDLAVTGTSPAVTTGEGTVFRRMELNSTGLISDEGIIKEKTRVLILDPGVYYVEYTINVPEDQTIDTHLALLYNREIIGGTARHVRKMIAGTGLSVSANALISVDSGGAELILGSTDAFSLSSDELSNIATLTIFSIA